MKKLLSLIFAGAVVFALTMPAFAQDTQDTSKMESTKTKKTHAKKTHKEKKTKDTGTGSR